MKKSTARPIEIATICPPQEWQIDILTAIRKCENGYDLVEFAILIIDIQRRIAADLESRSDSDIEYLDWDARELVEAYLRKLLGPDGAIG